MKRGARLSDPNLDRDLKWPRLRQRCAWNAVKRQTSNPGAPAVGEGEGRRGHVAVRSVRRHARTILSALWPRVLLQIVPRVKMRRDVPQGMYAAGRGIPGPLKFDQAQGGGPPVVWIALRAALVWQREVEPPHADRASKFRAATDSK